MIIEYDLIMTTKNQINETFLSKIFWTNPESARITLNRQQLRATLLYHEGIVSAQGVLWNIHSKHLGVGIYEVTLKRRN